MQSTNGILKTKLWGRVRTRRYSSLKSLITMLVLVIIPGSGLSAVLMPLTADLSGGFGEATGEFSLSIRLHQYSLIPTRFELSVDQHRIPISTDDFASFDGLDLSTLSVALDSGELINHGSESLVLTQAILLIKFKARDARGCPAGLREITVRVDTGNNYAHSIDAVCWKQLRAPG